uniref:Uncharacterized protein n=1 Tax=Fagus sylvatica TaxID=28930 RepID=A0A2N9JAB0_FAGSY
MRNIEWWMKKRRLPSGFRQRVRNYERQRWAAMRGVDELLSWCLRRPFIERLPPSSSTLVTLETTEAFGLEADDVKYVTQHFRYTFVNEKVKRSARYYSPGWRTWAAVAIQLAWRRYKHRLTLTSLSFIRPRRPVSRCSSLGEDRLWLFTALLTSPKPNHDDFDF